MSGTAPSPEARRIAAQRYYAEHADEINERIRKYRLRKPHKRRAHNLVKYALERGILVRPEACSGDLIYKTVACTNAKIDAHHDDYAEPLVVIWLCRTHHRNRHTYLKSKGLDPD